eukprot:CAMPEP_0197029606 /NCGR_PEP_ID=MMETSP1384-20130603/9021_1 /TAXON_ID=29189 /ORGANISM="Ammonia sp." /LENGTH=208 /DNA_ID=CAMNT_0042458809 /DNA_START=59 /DNA_END=685 /DNA_ORIENTATION=+
MGGKAIFGIILGIIGLVFNIGGVWLNEITRTEESLLTIVTYCGWQAYGYCNGGLSDDCVDAKLLSQEDKDNLPSDNDRTFKGLCEDAETLNLEENNPVCQNELGGHVWLGGMISSIVLAAIGVIVLIIPASRGGGAWALGIAALAASVAVVGFLVITNTEDTYLLSFPCMYRSDNLKFTPAASVYAAGAGILSLFIGSIVSCGAGKYD